MTVRTRFAPSPTGYLHIGGLRTALYAYLFARRSGGVFILRIEDTDQAREVPGAVAKIFEALKLAGLTYDEGPGVGGDYGPYVQSERKAMYTPYAWELVEKGHAYPCFCSKERLDDARREAEEKGETFKYDKHCLHMPKEEAQRRIDAGEPYVIRQNTPLTGKAGFDDVLYGRIEVDCATLDDMVLIKADGLPTYNFANVVDDHVMGITHVMRGTEYLSSSPKYNLLYDAFGWEKPLYVHLPEVRKDANHKLSKRDGDAAFEDLLAQGFLPEAVVNYITLLGWSPGDDREFFTLAELEQVFDLKGISKSPAIFDKDKLIWMNSEYIRRLPFERYMALAMPWFEKAGVAQLDVKRLAELMQGRTELFSRIPEMVDFLAERLPIDPDLYTHKKMKTDLAVAEKALALARPVLAGVNDWSEAALHD
ncbi:MAG: glutamate--tRNA ligase, partial [Oscillospiraceae bacterium]|nr:glutamate--tRNA ligase [Oscillospiraceae bacterium]